MMLTSLDSKILPVYNLEARNALPAGQRTYRLQRLPGAYLLPPQLQASYLTFPPLLSRMLN